MKYPSTIQLLLILVCCLAGLLKVMAQTVVELTPENFDLLVNGQRHALVEFYAPWCPHCKRLEPIYSQLAQEFASSSQELLIARLNSDRFQAFGKRFGVRGYPTIKFFPAGRRTVEEYRGGHDMNDLIAFIEAKTGLKSASA